MVDLETMGTAPGSAIVSIGAVSFDPEKGSIGEEFFRVVNLRSCERAGLTIDPDTVLWWLKQSEAARQQFDQQGAEDLPQVLGWLASWWRRQNGRFIWGHGANFDEPLLAWAFRATHVVAPWKYWDARCTRTIFALTGERPDRSRGVHHNALDDARAQAKAVIRAYRKLDLGGKRVD
ncbi:MAG: 3'-5' exonuclease [Martelella sp.]